MCMRSRSRARSAWFLAASISSRFALLTSTAAPVHATTDRATARTRLCDRSVVPAPFSTPLDGSLLESYTRDTRQHLNAGADHPGLTSWARAIAGLRMNSRLDGCAVIWSDQLQRGQVDVIQGSVVGSPAVAVLSIDSSRVSNMRASPALQRRQPRYPRGCSTSGATFVPCSRASRKALSRASGSVVS